MGRSNPAACQSPSAAPGQQPRVRECRHAAELIPKQLPNADHTDSSDATNPAGPGTRPGSGSDSGQEPPRFGRSELLQSVATGGDGYYARADRLAARDVMGSVPDNVDLFRRKRADDLSCLGQRVPGDGGAVIGSVGERSALEKAGESVMCRSFAVAPLRVLPVSSAE